MAPQPNLCETHEHVRRLGQSSVLRLFSILLCCTFAIVLTAFRDECGRSQVGWGPSGLCSA